MDQENEQNRSFRLPMIELVLIIGIFAIISVFLVRMFMGTNRLQKEATDLSCAVIKAESIAEEIKNTASVGEAATQLGMISYDNTSQNFCMYYDKDWNQTLSPSVNIIVVTSTITRGETGRMVNANIAAYSCSNVEDTAKKDALVKLNTKKWVSSK
ncbi:MAG: hypothetical protein PUC65_15600 [Clostridiales bacterium]|nr:hypothetical protein [Clostridiales bacterium]